MGLGVSAQGVYTSPPVDRMTDDCENITFPLMPTLLSLLMFILEFANTKV